MQLASAIALTEPRSEVSDKELSRLSKEIWGEQGSPGMRDRLRDVQRDLHSLISLTKIMVPIAVTVLLACLGWLGHSVYDLNGRVSTIAGEVDAVRGKQDALALSQLAQDPAAPQNAKAARQLLTEAKRSRISLPASAVENAARKFIEASPEQPAAWQTAVALLQYRSALNESQSPALQLTFVKPQGQQLTGFFNIPAQMPLQWDVSWSNELVPIGQAAIYEPIAGLVLPPGGPRRDYGHVWMLVHNPKGTGALTLDGVHLRNIVFENMPISYKGGPLIMENVYFVNCTFNVTPNEQGREFAQAVVTAPPTNAKIG